MVALTGANREAVLGGIFRPLKTHADGPADAVQLGRVLDESGDVLDEAIVARSAQGAIEINIHGGPAVAQAVLGRLAQLGADVAPARSAAPESFQTAHPQWNNPAVGREMLEILPAAASELVVEAISQQWSAGLSALVNDDSATAQQLRAAAERLAVMDKLLSPAEVVLVGPPNAGKSTLANALVGRAVSIVHETPGTTRDWVREQALLGGVPIWLTDTAGLFESPEDLHDIDAEAVRRACHRAESADLVLLISAGQPAPTPDWLNAKLLLRVAAKCDRARPVGPFDAFVSAHAGEGLAELAEAVLNALGLANIDPAAPAAFTQRQARLLLTAADAMDRNNAPAARELLNTLLLG